MYVDSKVLKADTASRMSEDRNPRARRLRVEAVLTDESPMVDTASRMNEDRNPRARRLRVEAVPREEASMVSMVDPASRMREG